MNWNRFDICEAWYLYAMLYHNGQFSKEYAIFGRLHRMNYNPKMSLGSEDDLSTENSIMIFDDLVCNPGKVRDPNDSPLTPTFLELQNKDRSWNTGESSEYR